MSGESTVWADTVRYSETSVRVMYGTKVYSMKVCLSTLSIIVNLLVPELFFNFNTPCI